ncbi:MAG: Threonine--tRNA ligase 2 [Chlamydiae bacterium]|nr:Threonine--tRNA ligase 2 [Chlamydiota bacterium]
MNKSECQAAAILLGAAIRKIFPHIVFLGSGVDEEGFYASFRDTTPFQEIYFPMLEKAMKEWGKQKLQMREMLASNAAELFIHKNEEILAETLRGAKGVVKIVQVDEFFDFVDKPIKYSPHFSLLGFRQDGAEVRVYGAAFSTQKELKNFLKLHRQYAQKNHKFLGKALELYEGSFWHPRGMKLLHILIEKWRNTLSAFGFEEIRGENPKEYFTLSGRKQFCFFHNLEDHIFSFENEDLISCLQIIEKWMIIFDFKAKWVLLPSRGKNISQALKKCKIDYVEGETKGLKHQRVELHIADGLGRFKCGPFLECEKEKISFSLFGNLAHFVALILEKTEGELPFWMSPEQVRLLPLGNRNFENVLEIFRKAQIKYAIDRDDCPLKEKMYRALRVKVPYVIIFGKQEEEAGKMKIRAYGSSHDQLLTIEQMKNFLAERNLESQ